jgi:hypothetical protein
MQMKTWSFGRIVTVCGILGVAMAAVAVFAFPPPYSSTAILRVPGEDKPTANVGDMVNEAATAALTRKSLAGIIATQNLYRNERTRMPMEDVIDKVMRRDIHITPIVLANARTRINGIEVRFDYPDPSKTQQVTQTLAERFAGFQVLDPPSPPERIRENYHRFRLALLGLLAGLIVGVGLALVWPKYTWLSKKPGEILTPLKRFFLCFAISVSAMTFNAILADQLFYHPLAWRFHLIVFLPIEYLVEGFGLRPTVISIVILLLFCAATWTGILYAFCALVESTLQKITYRTSSPE